VEGQVSLPVLKIVSLMEWIFNFVYSFAAYFFLVICIPIAIGLYRIRGLDFIQRQVLVLVSIALVNEVLATYLRFQGTNNLWVFHLFVPISFFFMLRIYKEVLKHYYSWHFFNFILFFFIIFSLVNSFFIQSIWVFNSNAISLSSAVYIVFSVLYFYQLLRNPASEGLEKSPMFWLNTGVLIYYSSTLILFLLVNYLIPEDPKLYASLLGLNIFFNIIINIFYTVVLWKNPQLSA
jgi:hypothetical protein